MNTGVILVMAILSDVELIKERFAKLLLGEDMSGTGKASVFGEQIRLEPMPPERKARWTREIDWLVSVTDHIVEFVPSQQGNMEIMITQQRKDLHMNIPALRKLDAILVVPVKQKKGKEKMTSGGSLLRKFLLMVYPDVTRKWLQFQKDSANQVLKAAMAINAQVLSEMEIPDNYIESLPKNGRASLGDSIYKSITVEYSDPDLFLSTLDLSSEHKILDIKNRIEALDDQTNEVLQIEEETGKWWKKQAYGEESHIEDDEVDDEDECSPLNICDSFLLEKVLYIGRLSETVLV